MLRLFALVLLLGLLGAGFVIWRGGQLPLDGPALGLVREELADLGLEASVKAALELNGRLAPYSLQVRGSGDVVTLAGRVPEAELRSLAVEVAAAVPGVRQVVDEIAVDPRQTAPLSSSRTLGESLDDKALEVRVRMALSLRRELAGSDVTVTAFRREVTLNGELAGEAQRAVALAAARDTQGVRKVQDALKVRGAVAGGTGDEVVARVERALQADQSLGRYRLRVERKGDALVVRGRVASRAEKDLAGWIARHAAGRAVENAVEVAS